MPEATRSANVADAVGGADLPNLESLGLGRALRMRGVASDVADARCMGDHASGVAGKGLNDGPLGTRRTPSRAAVSDLSCTDSRQSLIDEFSRLTGRPVVGNVAGSGTAMIDRYGAEHEATGAWIVYTSADSVFQVAAHESVVPLEELYGPAQRRARCSSPRTTCRV